VIESHTKKNPAPRRGFFCEDVSSDWLILQRREKTSSYLLYFRLASITSHGGSSMKTAKPGDRVRIDYVGKIEEETAMGTPGLNATKPLCEDTGPVDLRIGAEEILPGLERALVGMAPGEIRTVKIPAEEGYGQRDEELMISLPRQDLPSELTPLPGQVLEVTDDDGDVFPVTVAAITAESVVIDTNHPLAGKDMVFELRLLEIL
jgi:peptidylprolyl isomerase